MSASKPERDYLEVHLEPLRIVAMGESGQFDIDVKREHDRVVLSLEGELDMATAPRLQSAIDEPDLALMPELVLDLRALQFIDSTGLRVILAALQSSRERGQEFAITRGSPQVERLLSITGVTEHLRTIATPDQALLDPHAD